MDYAENIVWSWLALEKTLSSTWTKQNMVWSWLTLEKTSKSTWILCKQRRLVMAFLGDDGIVHEDWVEQRLVMIGLGEDVIGHVDYV